MTSHCLIEYNKLTHISKQIQSNKYKISSETLRYCEKNDNI